MRLYRKQKVRNRFSTISHFFLAQWEGFELEEAVSHRVFDGLYAVFAPFARYISAFCSVFLFCFKGENKGENRCVPALL